MCVCIMGNKMRREEIGKKIILERDKFETD